MQEHSHWNLAPLFTSLLNVRNQLRISKTLSLFPPLQNLVYNKLIIPKGVRIAMEKNITVKMNVQTMYKGDLLRAGKTYTVNKETAERWRSEEHTSELQSRF